MKWKWKVNRADAEQLASQQKYGQQIEIDIVGVAAYGDPQKKQGMQKRMTQKHEVSQTVVGGGHCTAPIDMNEKEAAGKLFSECTNDERVNNSWRLQMKKSLVWSLMLILICIGVLGFVPSAEAATSILMEETHVNAVTNGYILGNSTITQRRADIAIISIEDALPSVLPDGTWDVSKEKNGTVQAWLTVNASDSTKYDLHIAANGSIIAADGYYLFYMYRNCTEIRGLDKLDTSRIIRMYEMFGICENLTSLDLSGFNTSNVTNMSRMFSDCRSLTNLDVSNFDTSKVTSMSYMFYSCNSLTSLDVSNFNTSNVTDMSNMFYNCRSLTSLDVSNFNTSKVTSMQSMFGGCRSLTSLDVSNFNTSKVTKMTYMFNGCSSLKSLVLGMNFDKINGSSMFGATSKLTAIIAQSTTPMTLSTDTGISTNTILYVPNVTVETVYEAATNYSTVFGANRIRPILELVGGENIDVAINDSYTDEATVAGFNINTEADMFKQYGYYVVTENNVVANIAGTYTVKHTLYYKNPNVADAVAEEVMSVTRTVNVIEAAVSLTANGVTTNYVSFEDAITAANADSENITHFSKGIIKLLKDCTMASGVAINRNKNIVLDLNGCKLDANAITTQNVISCRDGSSYYPELAILDNSTAKTGTIERTTDAGKYYIVGAGIVVTVGTNDETVNTVSPKINTSGLSFYNWGANYWGNRGGFYDGQIIAKKDSIRASEAPYVPSGYNINKETSGELSTYTLVKDTTSPTLSLHGVYNITKSREDLANSNDEVDIAININDNYNVSNYFDNSVVDNFIFKVNGVKIAPKILNINYGFVDDNTSRLSITLTNVTGNGVLSVEIPEGAAADLAGNTNAATTLMSTMMIDNMPPTDTSAVINNGNKYTNKNTVTIDLNAVGALFVKFKQGKAGGYAYRTFVTPATASEPNGIRVGVPDGFEIATLDSTTGEVNGIVKEEDYSTITSAMVKAGLVIVKVDYDSNNNIVYGDEFVWVPTTIDGVNFGVPTTELSTDEENEDVKKAVEKYGGFYIARYEASGIKYEHASASFIYDENTLLASASMENLKYAAAILKPTGTLKSVRNETSSVGIPFDYTKNVCVNMYPGLSQMMGPYSYKATLQFLESQGINVVNAGSWGNTDVSNENIESEGLIPTGSNEAYKALNIYDLSGNAYEVLDEWTEKNTQKIKRAELENIKVASLVDSIRLALSAEPSILYTVQGNTYDATTTSLYTTLQTGYIDSTMSFRPVLYLIDSVTDDDWLDYEENSQISYTFDEGDGLKVINAWFKDDAGNITEVVLGEIILDTVKPVVKVSNVLGRKATLTLTDDVAGIDGYAITTTNVEPDISAFTAVSPSALSKTVTYTANASGKYYAWAKDQAGNISLVDTFDAVNPILMEETFENVATNKYILGNSTITQRRKDVAIISIEDTLPSTLPDGAWDVSKDKNGSVQAWLTANASDSTKYDLHIAANGNVIASSGQYLFRGYTRCSQIQGLDKLNTSSVTNMSSMFYQCGNLTSLDVSSLDTSKVTEMILMFSECSRLSTLNLNNFDTSNVTNMSSMFSYCTGLQSLNLGEKFNTGKVRNMSNMFSMCYRLTSIPEGLDLSNTAITSNDSTSSEGYAYMFMNCGALTSVTINSKYIGYQMFYGCDKLTDITITSDVQGVYNDGTTEKPSGAFTYTGTGTLKTNLNSSSTAITKTNYDWVSDKRSMGEPVLMAETKENVETNKYIFENSTITQRREDIAIISIENTLPSTLPSGAWDVSKNKDKSVYAWLTVNANNSAKYDLHIAGYGNVIASRGEYLFANYTNCTEIQGLSNLNTAIVANMASMFYGCSSLTSLDLSSFNTSNVTNMNSMFYGCSGLTSLDLKNFDTTNVTTIGAMFHECTGLTSLDVSSFNTSNVTNMDGAFYKCSGLKSFDLANFDTSKVTDMSWMFAWCGGVKQFNLSNFNTTNVTNMRYMFEGCSSLLDIDLSNFSTSKVTNMAGMFLGCYSLKSLPTGLDLTNTGITTNTSTSSGYAQMFHSCTSLTSATINSKYIGYRMFYGCNKLTDITITSDVQGVYSDGTTEKPSGAFTYTGTGKLKTTLNSSSTAITETNYDWAIDNRMLSSWHYMDSNGNYYSTLSEAFNGATTGSTITVIDDVEDGSEAVVETGKTFILDTNGKTITRVSHAIINNGTLSIINNGKIVTKTNSIDQYIILNNNILNIGYNGMGPTIEHTGCSSTYWRTICTYGTLNIYGGELITSLDSSITTNYYGRTVVSNGGNGTINIYGGKLRDLTGVNGMGIEIYDSGKTINMTGGEIISEGNGIRVYDNVGNSCSLDLNITGGSITANGNAILLYNTSDTVNVNVVSGSIISQNSVAIKSTGNTKIVIGSKDGQVNTNSPVIQSSSIGIEATNGIEFYDGIIKGKTNAIAKNSKATSEDGYGVYIYQDGEYEVAIPMVGWDISKTAGTDNVWAFLVADSTDSTKYNLVIRGTGEMKDYADYDSSEWKAYRSQITKLIIEEGVTSVGDRAFFGMPEITNIEFPSTMKTIGAFSFFDCTKVTGTINIPASVNSIGGNPFLRVPATKYTVEAGNTKYKVLNNAIVTIDGKEAISYPCGNTDTNIIVPDGVETIREYACASTKAVTIGLPNTLKSINFGGFAYNSSLPTIIIPSSVTGINGEAFLDNASLETVYLKSTVLNTLGDNAFTNLKSGSIIYTASKAIADKFVAGTHYTNGRTSIYYPPEITVQPISVTVNSGNNATFTITAQAGNPNGVTYKWQYRTSDTDNWKDCTAEQGTGYDTASFTIVQTKTAMNGYSYRCVISSSTYPNEIMTQDELADKLVSEVAKLNVELNIAGDEVIVDKTAPILKSHDISDTMKVPGTITITAVLEDPEVEAGVPGSGVNTSATRYAITDTNVAPAADASIWQASNVFTTSSRAMVYVWIKAVDNVGNVRIIGDMTSDRTSLADTTAPTIDSIKVTYDETDATLTIKATDTGSGIDKITVNGKEINLTRDGNSVTGVFDVTEEGIYVIIVTDVCGNETTATRTAYEIKYDGNTAEAGSVPMQIKINGVDRKLNMNTYTKVMHKFENWNTKKDGTGNTYAEGAMYSADESATMYAQWTCTEIPIVITKQPEDVELTEGESTVVTVEATGSNIVYRWQISEDGGTTWNDITGKTKNTLELNDTTLDMSGNKYRCILTNYYGDTISNAMMLTVNIKLVVGELELRKDTTTGAIYDVDIWTKSVIHVKLIPGVGGITTYMSLAGSAQTVEETTENSVIRTSGVTVLRVKTARGSAEVTKDYIIKVDKDAPIGGTIALDGKQREDDTTIKLKASGFVDEHSGIAQYVWEYKSNKEATFRQGKVDKSGEGESYFTFDAEDNTSYVVRVVVYDNVGNSMTVTADKEFSLIGTSVKMKPTIRFTNVDKIVINEETGNKEVRAKVIFKSSSPLTKIVIGGNQIDVSTITPKMIGKEYVYETTYVITSNGVYVASCEDSDGGKAKEEVAISVFNTPNIKYKIVESGTYKEIVFTSTVPVKILETTPSKYKTEVVTDSGEYSFTNKMLVTEDEIDINFVFVDEHGNESNTVNVKIEAVIGKSKFVRAVDDKAGNKYEPFDKMNVDTAYRLAQDMENKIATISSKVVSYYGTNNGQTDMFMSRARDVGATVYLMNASKAGTYNGKMIKDLGGNPTSEVATYGLQGIGTKQEYTSAYVKGATSNSLTTANTKYKDVITSVTTLRLYKGFAMTDYPSASGSLDTGFVVRTGEKAYATQNGETNTNSSFRITLINK